MKKILAATVIVLVCIAGAVIATNLTFTENVVVQDNLSVTENLNVTGYGGTIHTAAIIPKESHWVDVKAFGATGDGVTNDTAALQAAIDNAWVTGAEVRIPAGIYNFTNLTLPVATVSNRVLKITGAGSVFYGDKEHGSNKQYGTVLIQTLGDGTDAIAAVSSVYVNPTYILKDFTLVGPDTYAIPSRTTTSGNGIRISGTAVPLMCRIENVYVTSFYGSGKAGIWLDNVENSILSNVESSYSDIGIKLSTATNAMQFDRVSVQYTASYGIHIHDCAGQTWNSLLVQSNEKMGLYMNGMNGATFNSPYFENNNSTSTASTYAIYLNATRGYANQHVIFHGGFFAATKDTISLDGVSGYGSTRNIFSHNRMAGVGSPAITIADAFCSYNTVEETVTAAALSDSGTGTKFTLNGIRHDQQIVYWGTWSPGTIDDNAVATGTFAVTGAEFYDGVQVGFVPWNGAGVEGFIISGYVLAADNVAVTLMNKSGASKALQGVNIKIMLTKTANATSY